MIFANHFETAPFLCLLDYERWLLATVWWIVATNLAFRLNSPQIIRHHIKSSKIKQILRKLAKNCLIFCFVCDT